MNIIITIGQLMWICGVGFIIVGVIFARAYFDDYWHGTMSADHHAKHTAIILFTLGSMAIFLGLNADYKWIIVEVIK